MVAAVTGLPVQYADHRAIASCQFVGMYTRKICKFDVTHGEVCGMMAPEMMNPAKPWPCAVPSHLSVFLKKDLIFLF